MKDTQIDGMGNPAQEDEEAGTGTVTLEALHSLVNDLVKRVESFSSYEDRFSQLDEKLAARTKDLAHQVTGLKKSQPSEKPLTAKEHRQLTQFYTKLEKIPEELRAKVESRFEAGDIQGAMDIADVMLDMLPTPKVAPRSHGVMPNDASTALPATQLEFQALKRSNPEAAKKLVNDPSFNILDLK